MFTIGICDDDAYWRKKIRVCCNHYMEMSGQIYSFVEFSSGEEVLAYEGERIHILFLDIEMTGISGLEVMEKCRNNPLVWRIVFVSSHEEFRWDTLDLKTLSFLEKPVGEKLIEKCLKAVLREHKENVNIPVRTIDGECRFKVEDILYIHAQKNYVNLHMRGIDFVGYDSLKKLEEQLQGTTMHRIHRSYLVNLQYLTSLNWVEVNLTDGTVIPVGRMYYQSIKEAHFAYLKSVTIERIGGA